MTTDSLSAGSWPTTPATRSTSSSSCWYRWCSWWWPQARSPTPRDHWGRRWWPRDGNHHRRVGRRVPGRRRRVLSGLRRPRRRPATGHRRPAEHPPRRRPAAHRSPCVLVTAVALVALTLCTGIDTPARVAVELMLAAIYLAIGAVVGATVRNPVNGTVLLPVHLDRRRVLRTDPQRSGQRRDSGVAHALRLARWSTSPPATAAAPATSAGPSPGPWSPPSSPSR